MKRVAILLALLAVVPAFAQGEEEVMTSPLAEETVAAPLPDVDMKTVTMQDCIDMHQSKLATLYAKANALIKEQTDLSDAAPEQIGVLIFKLQDIAKEIQAVKQQKNQIHDFVIKGAAK